MFFSDFCSQYFLVVSRSGEDFTIVFWKRIGKSTNDSGVGGTCLENGQAVEAACDLPRVCWNKKAVHLGLYAQDAVEDACFRDKTVLETQRAEWTVSVATSSVPIRARIGVGAEPIVNDPSVRIVNLSGVNLNVRNIAPVELSSKLFCKDRFQAGDTIEFTSTFFTRCRTYRVEWKGQFTLSHVR